MEHLLKILNILFQSYRSIRQSLKALCTHQRVTPLQDLKAPNAQVIISPLFYKT